MLKKFFVSLAVVVISQACATAGYTGLTGLSVPGFEAPRVVAANQALIGSIVNQQGWAPYGQPYGQYGNVPVCRLQDLQGLPPISVNQPVLVRVQKDKKHQTKDVVGGGIVGAGLGGLSGGWQGAAYGGAAGAGGGLLVANHEQELCLLLPVKAP